MIHVSNGRYNFKGYGDTSLAVLVCPADIIHCPYSDHSKMRVLAVTPIAILESDCKFEFTPETEQIISETFNNHVTRLNNLIKEGDFVPASKQHTLIREIPKVNLSELFSTIKSIITETKNIVQERLIKI